MLAQLDSAVLEAVARASKRSSGLVHEEMREGVYSLATVACVAPWFGLFGTILGIINSFRGGGGEKHAVMAAVAKGLSESMWPTAFGLLVGLIALWSHEYLAGQLSALDKEMENASLELLNQLSRFRVPFTTEASTNDLAAGPMFGERAWAELSREDKFLRRSMILAGTMLPQPGARWRHVTLAATRFLGILRYGQRASTFRFSSERLVCLPILYGSNSCTAGREVCSR